MTAEDTLAKENNFAVRLQKDKDQNVVDQGLKLIDAQGLLLRDAGSTPESIARNAWLFGFDVKPLSQLVTAANTIDPNLGTATQQASVMTLASEPQANSYQPAALALTASSAPIKSEPTSQIETAKASSAINLAVAQINSSNDIANQSDLSASAPTLQQTFSEANAKALAYVDTSTYLNSLFRNKDED